MNEIFDYHGTSIRVRRLAGPATVMRISVDSDIDLYLTSENAGELLKAISEAVGPIDPDEVIEAARKKVLKSLDEVLEDYTGETDKGWSDADLPNLFKAVDTQVRNALAKTV